MLLFNNINSTDTNAFQNNQTLKNQTMNQIKLDSSISSLERSLEAPAQNTSKKRINKINKLYHSKDALTMTNELTNGSQESLTERTERR